MPKAKPNLPQCIPAAAAIDTLKEGMAKAVREIPALPDVARQATGFAIFETVPVGCFLFEVRDKRHEPHLHEGDWVIIDTNARDVVWGELHCLLYSDGPMLWQLNRVDEKRFHVDGSDSPYAWLSPLNKPRSLPSGALDMSGPLHMTDGPMAMFYLEQVVLGRVAGLFVGPREYSNQRMREAAIREHAKKAGRKAAKGGAP